MRMRLALALPLLLAACIQQTYPDPPPDPDPQPGWGTGPGGTGGDDYYGCHQDVECGTASLVCARDGECLSASDVKTIHVAWTVNGQPANTTTCATMPHLDLTFFDTQEEQFGFSPVPCAEGKFTVDKLPSWYDSVGLSRTGDYGAGGVSATFDTGGTATLDLVY